MFHNSLLSTVYKAHCEDLSNPLKRRLCFTITTSYLQNMIRVQNHTIFYRHFFGYGVKWFYQSLILKRLTKYRKQLTSRKYLY